MSVPLRFSSVTSITGLLPKPALVQWSSNIATETAFTEQDKYRHMETKQERMDYVRYAHKRKVESAASVGTSVHQFVEALNLGKPVPEWPLPVKARMDHFARFVAGFSPRIEAAETKVFHRNDRHYRGPDRYYAGTLDMLCEIDGRMAVVDIKTGKSVWPESALQINAYAYADFLVADPNHPGAQQITPKRGRRWYEWHGPAEDELPLPKIERGYVLHLRDDGYDLIEVPIDDELYEMFLALFAVDDWEQRLKKTAITGSVPVPTKVEA